MKLPARKRAGIVVAAVLGVDCVMHIFWATTGSPWPATSGKSLSRGLLNADSAFRPGVLFPLAAILLVATLMVLMRAGVLRRFAAVPAWLPQLVTIGTGAAVLVRAIAGVVWIAGIDASTATPFYWLNLALYTPACLVMFAASVVVLRSPAPRAGVSAGRPRLPADVRAARHR
jgi:hypothetical protein